jgi:hypothetical protein
MPAAQCQAHPQINHTVLLLLLLLLLLHRFGPKPLVARSPEDILAARGVKPTLSPNLDVLATVEALAGTVKRLLFIGVGCQVGSLDSTAAAIQMWGGGGWNSWPLGKGAGGVALGCIGNSRGSGRQLTCKRLLFIGVGCQVRPEGAFVLAVGC